MTSAAAPGVESRRVFEAITEFRAMGTTWWVGADEASEETLLGGLDLVEREEQRYSRFRPDSMLSRLNANRWTSDAALSELVLEAEQIRAAVGGAFDPTIGAAVISAGYDSTFEALGGLVTSAPLCSLTIEVEAGQLRLGGEGRIDLGGIAKGWTADLVGRFLTDAGCSRWLVDAGGDILVGGIARGRSEEPIALGLTGLTVGLSSGAVATSSTLRRSWSTLLGRMHHIIAPDTARPTRSAYIIASVVAPSAARADALATAMLVDPHATAAALPAYEAEALIIDDQGRLTMTPGLERHLRS